MIALLFAIMFYKKSCKQSFNFHWVLCVYKHRYVELMLKDKIFFICWLFCLYFSVCLSLSQNVTHFWWDFFYIFPNSTATFIYVFKSGLNNNIFMKIDWNVWENVGKCTAAYYKYLFFYIYKFDNCLGWYIFYL